jgi:hypothetical protein
MGDKLRTVTMLLLDVTVPRHTILDVMPTCLATTSIILI